MRTAAPSCSPSAARRSSLRSTSSSLQPQRSRRQARIQTELIYRIPTMTKGIDAISKRTTSQGGGSSNQADNHADRSREEQHSKMKRLRRQEASGSEFVPDLRARPESRITANDDNHGPSQGATGRTRLILIHAASVNTNGPQVRSMQAGAPSFLAVTCHEAAPTENVALVHVASPSCF